MHEDHGGIGSVGRRPGEPERGTDEEGAASGSLVIVTVEDGDDEFAKVIDEQLSVVTEWWRTGSEPERGFVQTVLRSPEKRRDVEDFLYTSGIRETERDEALVVYITSHGCVGPSGRHFLRLPDTDLERLAATGMPTNEIVIAALDSRARDVLVIVNACEAGGIDVELRTFARDLAGARTREGTLNVVATTAARTPVLGREFAVVLRSAYEWLREAGGITRPYLTISEFVSALEEATERLNLERNLQLAGPRPVFHSRLTIPTSALPNPGHRPARQVVTPARAEVSATHEELDYWLDRASGRASSDDPGWYFSGRQELNRLLAEFVSGPPGVLIVTGTAASGKSAVLARTVTLSDPTFRASPRYADAVSKAPADTVPDEGSVHVAVSARNRGPLSLIEAIGSRLGCERDGEQPATDALRQWQEGLRRFFADGTEGTVTIVVDGLDEARDAAACVRDVLVPLTTFGGGPDSGRKLPIPGQGAGLRTVAAQSAPPSESQNLRLLIGVRSSRPGAPAAVTASGLGGLLRELQAAFPTAREARTDGEGVRTDIEAYVTALLAGADWAPDHELAARAARLVARHVERSFLDARLAAQQLRRTGGASLLEDPLWFSQLDKGTVGLFENDLEEVANEDLRMDEVVALLRATAFGLGQGIPWAQLWPAVAETLLERRIEHADEKIGRLLASRLAGYLTHDTEDDRVVYRPAHDKLGAMLRRWPQAGSTPHQGGDPSNGSGR
ncbi:hypothetical protein ACFRK5_28955 [Streptomyces niveus]|uniref:hypothetical protein n=1 Tax=Streptomyces niveus TaxID=193462 RepID=UPI0036A96431